MAAADRNPKSAEHRISLAHFSFLPQLIGWFRAANFRSIRVVKLTVRTLLVLAAGLAFLLLCAPTQAQQHRATRLGHPATRFAPTMHTPEDLRSRFRDEKLRPDIASILAQWGWAGNLDDLHRAALSAEISEWPIPVGWRMPFMSSRKDGAPICLRDVLWAGDAPAPAYAQNPDVVIPLGQTTVMSVLEGVERVVVGDTSVADVAVLPGQNRDILTKPIASTQWH